MKKLQRAFISNKSTARLLNILERVEREKVFTLRELADRNKVSERTMASDIKYLREYFEDCIKLISGSKGYTFEEINLSRYREKKKNLFENECFFKIIEQIFYGEFYRIDELAYYYNYSESTFRRIIYKTSFILEHYGLRWVSNPLRIEGEEAALRKFFKDFYYEGVETPFTIVPDNRINDLFLKKESYSLGGYEVGTGITPQAFYYIVFITIKRVEQGKRVTVPKKLRERVFKENDFSHLMSLAEEIKKVYNVMLPKEELAWIYLVTISKRTMDREDQEKIFYERFNFWPEISQVTKQFLKERHISLKDQPRIENFINSFFLSRKINELLNPALNNEMLDPNYLDKENLKKNKKFLNRHKKKLLLNDKYTKETCASFTLYSDMILETYTSSKTIFFLLEGNHFTCQLIRMNAEKLLGAQHELIFVPIQMLTRKELNEEYIDLIVTNYSKFVTDFIDNTDYILIKAIPDEQDWLDIEKKIMV